jgi:hyperosmotically inducible protein
MKNVRTRSLLAAALSTALLFSASHVMAANPPANEPEENAQNDSNQPVTDTWITTKVKADLLATENVSGLDIKVETVDGVVTLSGAVANKSQKDKAIAVAKQIKGVKQVEASGLTLASK